MYLASLCVRSPLCALTLRFSEASLGDEGCFLNGVSILTTSRFEIHSVHSVVSTPHPVTATVSSSKFSLWLQDLVMDLIPKELERVRTALKIRYGHPAEFLPKLEDIDGWSIFDSMQTVGHDSRLSSHHDIMDGTVSFFTMRSRFE